MTAPESITRDELAAVFREALPINLAAGPGVAADAVFAHVARSREPEYEPGAMYQDAAGDPWQFAPAAGSPGRCWLTPGVARESAGYPLGPFRKLVPLPSAAEVEKALPAGWANGAEIAAAVVRLLEGGSDD